MKYLVKIGAHVQNGDPLVEIEVMKMVLQVCVEESGIVTILKPQGMICKAGDVIATLKLDNPDS